MVETAYLTAFCSALEGLESGHWVQFAPALDLVQILTAEPLLDLVVGGGGAAAAADYDAAAFLMFNSLVTLIKLNLSSSRRFIFISNFAF